MPSIQRLELVNGQVFSVGELWPGFPVPNEKEKQLRVSHIFLAAEETETVKIDDGEGGEDDDDDEEILRTSKSEYEVWGLTDELGEAYAAISRGDQDEMRRLAPTISTQAYRRRYRYDVVSCADDIWDFDEAFQALKDRVQEHELGGAREEPAATATPSTNGGGATASASP